MRTIGLQVLAAILFMVAMMMLSAIIASHPKMSNKFWAYPKTTQVKTDTAQLDIKNFKMDYVQLFEARNGDKLYFALADAGDGVKLVTAYWTVNSHGEIIQIITP